MTGGGLENKRKSHLVKAHLVGAKGEKEGRGFDVVEVDNVGKWGGKNEPIYKQVNDQGMMSEGGGHGA